MAWDRSRQRLHVSAILLAACAFAASAPVWAQDVAEAARQEQARKEKQANGLKHVYTDEDLKRAKILTREDRELLDAKKRQQPAPGATPAPEIDAQALDQLPLGDVARMYRAMKELNAQSSPADFHLPFAAAPVLASPKPATEFVDARPNAVHATAHKNPVAPAISDRRSTAPNSAIKAAQPHVAFEMPRPRTAQHSNSPAPEALTFPAPAAAPVAISPAPKAVSEFVIPGPRELQPVVRREPVATSFPNASAPTSITVKRGDTFWKLAQVNLGDGRRWHELAIVNPNIDPQHLVAGTVINLVAAVPAKPEAPSAPEDSSVKIVKGDSLWKIAKAQLGAGGFWGCLAKANPRILDANRIYAGDVLTVPANCDKSSSK